MEKDNQATLPRFRSFQSTPVTCWQVTKNGQDWQGRMGSGATVHLQQEYGTLASTSHANTEPLALGTDSDLFSEASKSNEITGFFFLKKSFKMKPNKFKNHALDIFSFQNWQKTLSLTAQTFSSHCPPCSCRKTLLPQDVNTGGKFTASA